METDQDLQGILLLLHQQLEPFLGAVTFRLASGDSENSELEEPMSIFTFESNDIDLTKMKAPAADPERTPCITDLCVTACPSLSLVDCLAIFHAALVLRSPAFVMNSFFTWWFLGFWLCFGGPLFRVLFWVNWVGK